MKDFKEAIIQEFLEKVTFSDIGAKLQSMGLQGKNEFALHCIEGNPQLNSRLKGICMEIAKEKAQAKIDQINADGTITVAELSKILKFLK